MNKEVEILLGRKAGESAGADVGRFNGTWAVNLACTPQNGALGYSFHFMVNVKDGVLHGQYGTDGTPSSLTLDGKIKPDGSALINASGLTGDPKYIAGYSPRGSVPYFYHIEANFVGSHGTGKRIEDRQCNFIFVKK